MSDLHEQLMAAANARLELARAATPGPWRYNPEKMWNLPGMHFGEEFVGAGPLGNTTCVAGTGMCDDPQSMADAAHIAANDPATVIRHCERDLQVLERHRPAEDEPRLCRWCFGANGEDYFPWPCPEFTDLATAYDITDSAPRVPQPVERGKGSTVLPPG